MSVLFVSAVHNGRAEELSSSQKQSRADFLVKVHQSTDSPIEQIAKIAGLSVAATKSRLLRARADPTGLFLVVPS
jgi:DNA-directed RNA polymerase specialized sigma24 family protein